MKTHKYIADAVGVTPGAVGNIINGRRRPSWDLAKRLSSATGTMPYLWLEGTPEDIKAAINDNTAIRESAACQ